MRVKFVEPELKSTLFHRLDVRTKLAVLFCVAVTGVALTRWPALALMYLAVLGLVAAAHLSGDKLKALLVITFLTVWGIMWVQAVFYAAYPRTPLLYLLPPGLVSPSAPVIGGLWEGVAIYYEGFTYGAAQSLRLLAPLTLGLLIFWTEEPVKILVGLNRLRLPYAISFMVMTCLRFIPITVAEAGVTISSQKLRKDKPFDPIGILLGYGIYKTARSVMLPLLANCVRKSAAMAKSADSRAFRAYDRRSELHATGMKAADKVIVLVAGWLTSLVLLSKLLLYLRLADVYASEALQPVYWFAHHYL